MVEAVNHLKVRSCLIDGEVVCCDERGLAVFHILRRRQNEASAFLYAFDLLELDGTDMRREPLEVRKATLASILRKSRTGVRLNEHLEHPEGEVVFRHACKMGLECDSACKKDPLFGVIGIQTGPRHRGPTLVSMVLGSRGWDAGRGDDCKNTPGVFQAGQADQGDLPGAGRFAEGGQEGYSVGGD